jgi:hypothetical protein
MGQEIQEERIWDLLFLWYDTAYGGDSAKLFPAFMEIRNVSLHSQVLQFVPMLNK